MKAEKTKVRLFRPLKLWSVISLFLHPQAFELGPEGLKVTQTEI